VEAVLGNLSWLALLACPLMMLVCLWSMGAMGRHRNQTDAQARHGQTTPGGHGANLQRRVAELGQEVARLRPIQQPDAQPRTPTWAAPGQPQDQRDRQPGG
jgi:hypothetical protein